MTATVALSIKKRVGEILEQALDRARASGDLRGGTAPVWMETPKRGGVGGYANAGAMAARAPGEKRPPRQVADILVRHLPPSDLVERIDIAGPGYLNVTVRREAWWGVVAEVLEAGPSYGRAPASARSVQVEFVSANPTGPLPVGHGRLAAVGVALANLLAAAGDRVERE